MGKCCFVENTDIVTFNDHSFNTYCTSIEVVYEIIDYLTSTCPKKTIN